MKLLDFDLSYSRGLYEVAPPAQRRRIITGQYFLEVPVCNSDPGKLVNFSHIVEDEIWREIESKTEEEIKEARNKENERIDTR